MTPDRSIDIETGQSSSKAQVQIQPDPSRPRLRAVYFLILAAVAALPYLNSLPNSFVYDDFDQVLANPYLRNFHHLREILTSSVWSFMGDFRGSTNYYRPVMLLGYLLCYQTFGPNAWGFHLANFLVNVGVVLLVFLVTLRLFRSTSVAMAAACIFALHPIHSEAVDWIAAVTELELAFFYLLTFWFFLASARARGKLSVPLQAAMAASFALTLLSKEQAVTLPFLALIYEHFFREDRAGTSKIQKLQRYGVLWLLSLVYLAFRVRYLGGFAPSVERTGFGTTDLMVSALALMGRYCWKLVWPVELCGYYPFPAKVAALHPWALWGALALMICAVVFWVLLKLNRQAAFGMVWLFATLAPVLNVRWMTSNPFAERYLYLASVGFCWMAGWAATEAWKLLSARGSRWRIALPLAAALAATLSAARILARNRDWHDNLTFYIATLKVSPDAYYIHNNLGTVYWAMGDVPAAKKEWLEALRLAPESEFVLHNLGLVANKEKEYPQAETYFLHALAIRPNYMDAHLDLGQTYAAVGMFDKAETEMIAAEKLSPLSVRAHNTLSEFYLDRRQLGESEAQARRSVEIEPTTQGDWDLGLAEWMTGDRASAEKAFLGAEALDPSSARGHFMLGLLYLDAARNADAIREYRTGLQLDPGNQDALANLRKLEILEIAHQ